MASILSPSVLQLTVSEAYANLYKCMADTHDAMQVRRDVDVVLVDTRNEILHDTDPKDLGSNEAQRTATVNVMLCDEIDQSRKAQEDEQEAIHCLRIAEKRVEEARAYLTIARIAAALPERSH